MLHATPGRANEKARRATHEQGRAGPVGLSQLLREREVRGSVESDVERRYDKTDGAERKVDVEAPTPRRLLREIAPDKRANDAAD